MAAASTRQLLRELVASMTLIREGSQNEQNAVDFMFENAAVYHNFPDVRPTAVEHELQGLLQKLRIHRHEAVAGRISSLVEGLLAQQPGQSRDSIWSTIHLLLELSGRPLDIRSDSDLLASALPSVIVANQSAPAFSRLLGSNDAIESLSDWRNEFLADSGDEDESEGASDSDASTTIISDSTSLLPVVNPAVSTSKDGPHASSDKITAVPPVLPPPTLLSDGAANEVQNEDESLRDPAAARMGSEDVYIAAVLDVLQGHVLSSSSSVRRFAPIVTAESAQSPDQLLFDGLSLLAPPNAQLISSFDALLSDFDASIVGVSSLALLRQLRRQVISDASSSGSAFLPLIVNDAAGYARLSRSPLSAAEIPPLQCHSISEGPLRTLLSTFASFANRLQWVHWVCAVVQRLSVSGGAPELFSSIFGDDAMQGVLVPSLCSFGPASAQLASFIQSIIDDVRLDAASIQAAHNDRLAALARAAAAYDGGDGAGIDAAFTAEQVLSTCDPSGASAVPNDADLDGTSTHPRLTLTVLSAWLRRYKPLVDLCVELCQRCFLAPVSNPVGVATDFLATVGLSALSSQLRRAAEGPTASPGLQSRLLCTVLCYSQPIFPRWAAARCMDSLVQLLQRNASTSYGSGSFNQPLMRLGTAGSGDLPQLHRNMPLSDLPDAPTLSATTLRLLLAALKPYLASVDSFIMQGHSGSAGDASVGWTELPYSSASSALSAISDISEWLQRMQTSAAAAVGAFGDREPRTPVRGISGSGRGGSVVQRLLFSSPSSADGDDGAGVSGGGRGMMSPAEDEAWCQLDALIETAAAGGVLQDLISLTNPLCPSFLASPLESGYATDEKRLDSGSSTGASLILTSRAYRTVLTSVDAAAERRDPVLRADEDAALSLAPSSTSGAVGQGFGSLLFAPLSSCFHARLAGSILVPAASVSDAVGPVTSQASHNASAALDSDSDSDPSDNNAPLTSSRAHDDDTGVASQPFTARALFPPSFVANEEAPSSSTSAVLDSSSISSSVRQPSDVTASTPAASGPSSLAAPRPVVKSSSSAASVVSSISVVSNAAPADISVRSYATDFAQASPATNVNTSRGASSSSSSSIPPPSAHNTTTSSARSSASIRPVFHPGYAPLQGGKRSAWWDIDAQVDTKALQEAEERAAAAAKEEERKRRLLRRQDRAASGDVIGTESTGVTSNADGASHAPLPPRPRVAGRRARGSRGAASALLLADGHNMSAILEDSEEEEDDDEDRDSEGGEERSSGDDDDGDDRVEFLDGDDHSDEDGELTHNDSDGEVTSAAHDGGLHSASLSRAVDLAAEAQPLLVVSGIGSGPTDVPAASSAGNELTHATESKDALRASAAQHAARPTPVPRVDETWLLPEHAWAATSAPVTAAIPDSAAWAPAGLGLGGPAEWDAVVALLYPEQRQQETESGLLSDLTVAVKEAAIPPPSSAEDELVAMLRSASSDEGEASRGVAFAFDLGCERVTSLLRRDLVGCLMAQHRLLSAAVTHALLQRLHLLPRHLWALRAVCLFQQGQAMGEFLRPLFTALAAGHATKQPSALSHYGPPPPSPRMVRDSFRLTSWLQNALALAPGPHNARPASSSPGIIAAATAAVVVGHSGASVLDATSATVVAVGRETHDPESGGWLYPSDFSLTFTGFTAETDDALLKSGLRLTYAPASAFPLSLVLGGQLERDYNAVFGHLLWVKYVLFTVESAVREAVQIDRDVEAHLSVFPADAPFISGVRACMHTCHAHLHALLHFAQGLHSHQLHSLLTSPWSQLVEAMTSLAKEAGASGGAHAAAADDERDIKENSATNNRPGLAGGIDAIRALHSSYLTSLRRLCLLGEGQRAAAAVQQSLLQRADFCAHQLQSWFAGVASAAQRARALAMRDPAVVAVLSQSPGHHEGGRQLLRHCRLSDATIAGASREFTATLAGQHVLNASAAAFAQQLAFVVKAALAAAAASPRASRSSSGSPTKASTSTHGGISSSSSSGSLQMSDLAAVLDYNGFYSSLG